MIKSLAHVALMASDGEQTKRFYTELLGFTETDRLQVPGAGTLIFLALGDGETQIELFSGGHPLGPDESPWGSKKVGYTHLCLLADDVREETERLKGLGVQFLLESHDVAGLRVSFFPDPDGNVIELLQPRE